MNAIHREVCCWSPRPSGVWVWLALALPLIAMLPSEGLCATRAATKSSPASVEEPLEEVEILGANKYPVPVLMAPQNVSVITRRQIKELCPRDIPELLKLATGVDVFRKTVGDFETSMQGTNRDINNRIIVLIDGKPMTTPAYGCTVWQQIPVIIDTIERIEIVKGPCSAQYGANAFAGVINIVTDHATPRSDEGVRFVTTLGDRGQTSQSFRTAQWARDHGYTLTLRYWKDNGVEPLTDLSHTPIPGYERIPNNLDNLTGVFDWERRWGQNTRLSARVSRVGSNRDAYNMVSNFDDPRTSSLRETSTLWFVELFRQISKRKAMIFKLQSNRHDVSFGAGPFAAFTLDSRTAQSDRFTEAELQGRSYLGQVGYIYGATFRESVSDGLIIDRTKPIIRTGTVYGQAEYQFNPKTTGFLGLMGYESSQNGFDYSPKVSVLRKLGEHEVVRAGWGRSFRAPEGAGLYQTRLLGYPMRDLIPGLIQTLQTQAWFGGLPPAQQTALLNQVRLSSGNTALAVDGSGNPSVLAVGNDSLKNEHLSQLDLGWEKEDGSRRLKFDAWYSVMSDMIFNAPFVRIGLKPTFSQANDPFFIDPTLAAFAAGFSQAAYDSGAVYGQRLTNTNRKQRALGFSAEAGDNLSSRLRFDLNYTYQHVKLSPADYFIESYPLTGLGLATPPFTPEHKANLVLRYRPTDRDTITAVTHYSSDYWSISTLLTNAARVPAYTTVDLSILHQFRRKKRQDYLSASVKNLFNDLHHEAVGALTTLNSSPSFPAGGYLWDRFWIVSYGTHF